MPVNIDLTLNTPGEDAPRPPQQAPLWPVIPFAGLGVAGYAVARRKTPFAADHDFKANDYKAGETERFVAGAILAGMAGGAAYLAGSWLIAATPMIMRTASDPSQQVIRLAQPEAGAVNPAGVLRIGSANLKLSRHAAERISRRGLSLLQIESALIDSRGFEYFHDGAWKIGYYDPASRIFLAQHQGNVITVIANVKPQYIENLRGLRP